MQSLEEKNIWFRSAASVCVYVCKYSVHLDVGRTQRAADKAWNVLMSIHSKYTYMYM